MAELLFDQIEKLHENCFYDDLITIASLVISYSERNPEYMSPQLRQQLWSVYADALYQTKHYRESERAARRVLQLKKSNTRLKTNTSKYFTPPHENKDTSDNHVNLKYNLHNSLLKMGDKDQALLVLQSIPSRNRTAKINYALAKLLQESGQNRTSTVAYKEVLKACPLVFRAAEALLDLNERETEVNTITLIGLSHIPNIDWVITWFKACYLMRANKNQEALNLFKTLAVPEILQYNSTLLVKLGICYYNLYDYKNAVRYLHHEFSSVGLTSGLDYLVSCLVKLKRFDNIESYIVDIPTDEYTAENWYVLAVFTHHVTKKNHKALYFAQKACLMDPQNKEAMVLKAQILFDMKKFPEAKIHFKEVIEKDPRIFEAHRGLVNCFLATVRPREATAAAKEACNSNPTVRTHMLYASVLAKDPNSLHRARELLLEALILDKTYLPAVYFLAELYERENKIDAAIRLLDTQLKFQTTSKLHQMLGSMYAKAGAKHNKDKAMQHFNLAIKLDQNNRRAIEGLNSIDSNVSYTKTKLDSTNRCCVTNDPMITGVRNEPNELLSTPGGVTNRPSTIVLVDSSDTDATSLDGTGAERSGLGAPLANEETDTDESIWLMDLDVDNVTA